MSPVPLPPLMIALSFASSGIVTPGFCGALTATTRLRSGIHVLAIVLTSASVSVGIGVGVAHDGPAHGHPLALAAGEAGRFAVEVVA